MMNLAMMAAVGMVALGMALNLHRLVRGPEAPDRILALDTLTINTIALVMLLGMLLANTVFFEPALLIAMVGFVGTAALCKFLLGGDIIE